MENGIPIVFVIQEKNTNAIQGVCDDWESVQKHQTKLINLGYNKKDLVVSIYRVQL